METETKVAGIKTKIHTYQFYINEPEGKAGWEKPKAKLEAQGIDCMESFGGGKSTHYDFVQGLDGKTITLETGHLFNNQWNTAPIEGVSESGLRVFDWALDYMPYGHAKLRQGHYLEQTEEMREARSVRLVCGYCGAGYGVGKPELTGEFCDKCLDSPYLKESELRLLRLLPAASSFGANRAALTPEESAVLLPEYVRRQTTGSESRALKERQAQFKRVEQKYRKEKTAVEEEYQGMRWLWEHAVNLDNVLYYSHTQTFAFGWRSPVSDSVRRALLDLLCEFAYAYSITGEGGISHESRDKE